MCIRDRLNTGLFVLVSMRWRPRLGDQLQAASFLDPYAQRPPMETGMHVANLRVADLIALAGRIVGERSTQRAFADYREGLGKPLAPDEVADRALIQFTERLLASAIGADSARLTLTSALRGSGLELGEVVGLLDHAGQALRFNQQMLMTTLENISQGVSVVDAEMRLVTWNRQYQEMFGYPEAMLYVGRPVADLIRWNAGRGEMGEGDVEMQILSLIRI